MSDSPFPDRDTAADAKRHWFRASVLPHEPQLRDYIRRIGRGRIDVDDLTQDVLVRLFSNQNSRQAQQPAAFMRAMARNMVIDALRREKVVAIEFQGDLEGSAKLASAAIACTASGVVLLPTRPEVMQLLVAPAPPHLPEVDLARARSLIAASVLDGQGEPTKEGLGAIARAFQNAS